MSRIRVQYNPPPMPEPQPWQQEIKPVKPLTHHEILSLIEPFTRRGRHADLTASDRASRRLVFKPIEHAEADAAGPLREVLTLDLEESGDARLVRTVTDRSGLAATLQVEGADIGTLLELAEQVPVSRHFPVYEGVPVARSYRIKAAAAAEGAGPAPRAKPMLTEAFARIEGVNLELRSECGRKLPAEVKLTADPGQHLKIPEDLLAVLGWSWRPVLHFVSYWRGTIRAPFNEPERTAQLEYRLRRSVEHLKRTLGASPALYHARHVKARWRVAFQRAIPLLIGLAILAAAPAVQFLQMENNSLLRMLIFHAPPMMMVGFFMFRELPRIEIPPLPRALKGAAWIVDATGRAASPAPLKATQS